eukprot:1806768-Prymnesium_polylepis.1
MPEFERAPRAADRARPCLSGESGPLASIDFHNGAKSRSWTHVDVCYQTPWDEVFPNMDIFPFAQEDNPNS